MIPEGYEEGRIAMRIARLLPVIAVAISLLANRNNAGWTTFPGLRTPNLQKENRRCRVRRDTPQAVSAEVGEIERRFRVLEKSLEKIGTRASSNAGDTAEGLGEAVASALFGWADRRNSETWR
jgi:hypothetical protein